jgi:thiosulfate/3-mercaptopyruvate sulfurtransferase
VPLIRQDLVRGQQLITPAWLASLMTGAAVQAAPTKNWRLLEVGCGAPDDFLNSHLPGAAYLDTHRLEAGPFWNKVPDDALLQLLLGLGVAHDTTVVVYGRNTTAAARAAHLMLYAGVTDVRLLDGGFAAWLRAGLPCATGEQKPCPPAPGFGAAFPGCPHYLINTAQAAALLRQPDSALVSIRTQDEFTGKTSGYPYISAKGDIPGARWGQAGDGSDVNNMSAFQWPDGTMRPAQEIIRFWQEEAIHPGLQTAFYCGTGWRASVAFYYSWLMGWENISVYDGGWFEWSHSKQVSEISLLQNT